MRSLSIFTVFMILEALTKGFWGGGFLLSYDEKLQEIEVASCHILDWIKLFV